jgi:hypothetical protein
LTGRHRSSITEFAAHQAISASAVPKIKAAVEDGRATVKTLPASAFAY